MTVTQEDLEEGKKICYIYLTATKKEMYVKNKKSIKQKSDPSLRNFRINQLNLIFSTGESLL